MTADFTRLRGKAHVSVLVVGLLLALAGCAENLTPAELMARAEKSLAAGEFRAAMIDLKNLVQQQPQDAKARFELGKVLLATGDPLGSISELKRARELGIPAADVRLPLVAAHMAAQEFEAALREIADAPDQELARSADLLEMRGRAFVSLEQDDEAEASFAQALALQPRRVSALTQMALLSARIGRPQLAEEYLGRAQIIAPNSQPVQLVTAELHYRAGRYEEARAVLDKVIAATKAPEEQRTHLSALAMLADLQISLNDADGANATLAQLEKLAPNARAVIMLKARAYFLKQDFARAREALELLIATDPHDKQAQLFLGMVMFSQGNLGQAEMYLGSLVVADPENQFARRLLSETRFRQGRADDAVKALQVPDDPTGSDPELIAYAGRAWLRTSEPDKGILYLERGSAANPDDLNLKLELAAAYISRGRTNDAVNLLRDVPEQAGPRRDVLLTLAHVRNRDDEAALAAARKLSQSHPKEVALRFVAASVFEHLGKAAEADEEIKAIIALAPDNARAHLIAARFSLARSDDNTAEKHVAEAEKVAPKSAEVATARARIAEHRGDYENMVYWLEQAGERDPDAVEPRLILARYYISQRKFEDARVLAERAVAIAPEDGRAVNLLALTLAGSNRQSDALQVLQRGPQRRTAAESASPWIVLARGALAAGRPDQAADALRRGLEREPENVEALTLLGTAAVQQDNRKEAAETIAKLKKLRPKAAFPFVLEGDAAMRRRDPRAAVTSYSEARKLDFTREVAIRLHAARRAAGTGDPIEPLNAWLEKEPRDIPIRLAIAEFHTQTGQIKEAEAAYEAVLERSPREITALNNLAWLRYEARQPGALDLARQAHEVDPNNPDVADTYGWLLVEAGKVKEGVELLRKSATQRPETPTIQYHLAAGLARLGAGDEARNRLNRLLDRTGSFPEKEQAERLLASLQDAGS